MREQKNAENPVKTREEGSGDFGVLAGKVSRNALLMFNPAE